MVSVTCKKCLKEMQHTGHEERLIDEWFRGLEDYIGNKYVTDTYRCGTCDNDYRVDDFDG